MKISRIKALIKKELIQLKRDKTTFGMIVAIPIIWLLMFGYAINMDPKNLPTAVNSRDNSPFTRSIVSGLVNSGYFKITDEISSEKSGENLLKQGKVLFVITIPENLKIPHFKEFKNSTELAKFIREKSGLYLSSGEIYGSGGENFLRLNIATPKENLLDGLERFKRALGQ